MTILILTGVGLAAAVLIYLVNVVVPHKVKGLEEIEEIAGILPGINCGACGYPGCFGYAQGLVKDANLIQKTPCGPVLQDTIALNRLGEALGMTLDASAMAKKAFIHCGGNSEIISDYAGAMTCKGAAQLLRGYEKCPYACSGLGDCIQVCLQGAIFMDEEKKIVRIDQEKCNGCGLCKAECPMGLIELVPVGTKIAFLCNYEQLRDIPGREKCDNGCTHCRKCLKACTDEGVMAIEWNKVRGIPEFNQSKCTLCGKCIEVCESKTLADFTRATKPKLVPVG
jgi:Na+-translocating ferredoxin:NAD+ oxidoreductase RNF subunit RnfB